VFSYLMNWWAATVGRIAGIPEVVRIYFNTIYRRISFLHTQYGRLACKDKGITDATVVCGSIA